MLHPKIKAAGQGMTVGGAVAFIVVWALNTYAKQSIPDTVTVALGVVLTALPGLIAGYLKASSPAG